jgi:site-specific recombinase XerD
VHRAPDHGPEDLEDRQGHRDKSGDASVTSAPLRHACGAELLRRTNNLRIVQEQFRHVDVQTTTGYTRLTQQDVRQALETLDDEGE